MALSAERGAIMVFLILVTCEAGLTCSDLPRMRCVTTDTGNVGVFTFVMESAEVAVAGPAIDHGLEFCFFKMACLAGHGHHRGGGVNLMTRDAVER
jgi:hypothetical protein